MEKRMEKLEDNLTYINKGRSITSLLIVLGGVTVIGDNNTNPDTYSHNGLTLFVTVAESSGQGIILHCQRSESVILQIFVNASTMKTRIRFGAYEYTAWKTIR